MRLYMAIYCHIRTKICILGVSTCILGVWTCILGAWTCILGVWTCIWVSGLVFGCLDLYLYLRSDFKMFGSMVGVPLTQEAVKVVGLRVGKSSKSYYQKGGSIIFPNCVPAQILDNTLAMTHPCLVCRLGWRTKTRSVTWMCYDCLLQGYSFSTLLEDLAWTWSR